MLKYFIALAFVFQFGFAQATDTAAPTANDKIQVSIDGMTCGACSDSVKKGLSALSDQIEVLEVSVKNKSATIKVLKAADQSPEKLKALKDKIVEVIKKANFTVTKI